MKNTLLALTLIIAMASSSFAGASFLIAPGMGEGKLSLLGMYTTNHIGTGYNSDDVMDMGDALDTTGFGLSFSYGLTNDLDIIGSYSLDSMPNIGRKMDGGQERDGNSSSIGFKYTFLKDGAGSPVDLAAAIGYGSSVATIKADSFKWMGIGGNAWVLGCIVSKLVGNTVPYGAIAYKSMVQNAIANVEPVNGVGLMFNLGVMVGITNNMALAVEYNTENRSWSEYKAYGSKVEAYTDSVSGISMALVYNL